MNKRLILNFWSVSVGAMDAVTGLLLVIRPRTVLGLLEITPPAPEALVFVSWIGVFVMAVGLSYSLALGRRARGETVWIFTALVRILVAGFLTFRILDGSLPTNWVMVAGADAAVAITQLILLRAGWWKEVPL
jgi:hypothetical protein